ncbi:GNAT family N-acetyltransferase [Exiguobacterium artemiae]|uniref:GNAT family N-acetyltransferase n=1 Tax=Exiguobacterium artemiae TaxID=340145 RepID=UPI0029645AF4|nr:GNAT family protein [Exiguobacterium sibiricum]MDW2886562.1 GNAT family protein [Exiguobacterium sibiricum]
MNLTIKPTLVGTATILRPFEAKDFPLIEQCLQDSEVLQLTGSEADIDRERLKTWYGTRHDQPDRLDLAVIDKATGTLIGEIVVNDYQSSDHSMNFRILIGEAGRNRGLGTEATRLLIHYLFRKTSLARLTLSVFDFNPRARHVYEKLGFQVTGVEKDDFEVDGRRVYSILMVLTRERYLEQ